MRPFFSTIAAAALSVAIVSPAFAGDGRYYERRVQSQNDAAAALILGLGFGALAGAIIGSQSQPRYYAPPRYHGGYAAPRPRGPVTYRLPMGCLYPRPGVYYNGRQYGDPSGRIYVCPGR